MNKCHSLHFPSCSPHQKSLQERGFSLCHPTQWASSPQAVKFSFKMCFQHSKDRTREMQQWREVSSYGALKKESCKHQADGRSEFSLLSLKLLTTALYFTSGKKTHIFWKTNQCKLLLLRWQPSLLLASAPTFWFCPTHHCCPFLKEKAGQELRVWT